MPKLIKRAIYALLCNAPGKLGKLKSENAVKDKEIAALTAKVQELEERIEAIRIDY